MTWFAEWSWVHFLGLCYLMATIGCILRVLYRQTNTGTTFAWLSVLFVFPMLGVALYLLFGEPRLSSRRQKRNQDINHLALD